MVLGLSFLFVIVKHQAKFILGCLYGCTCVFSLASLVGQPPPTDVALAHNSAADADAILVHFLRTLVVSKQIDFGALFTLDAFLALLIAFCLLFGPLFHSHDTQIIIQQHMKDANEPLRCPLQEFLSPDKYTHVYLSISILQLWPALVWPSLPSSTLSTSTRPPRTMSNTSTVYLQLGIPEEIHMDTLPPSLTPPPPLSPPRTPLFPTIQVGKKVSGMDLAEYFNGGREKDASPPPLPSAPSHPDTATGGGLGVRDSSGGGTGEIGGDRAGGGGDLGGAGGEGLRHRNVTGGGGGGGGSRLSGAAGGMETNGFSGAGRGTGAGREAAAGPTFDVPPDSAAGANGVGEISAAGGGGGWAKGDGGKGGGKDGREVAAGGEGEDDRPRAGSMSTSALVGVFKGMMKERLVLVTFVLQLLRPAQDLAPLVALKFSGGASVLAGITSSRSLCRVLVPMTPLIPWLVRLAGGHSSAGAAAKMGGDRAVAAAMCVLMAGLVACVPAVGTLRDLHHLMAVKGLCYIVRESTAGAVMARAAGTASVGAFFGWQHCIKGFQGTFSHFLTGWLSGYSISLPYYVVAFCDLLYAFAYLYV